MARPDLSIWCPVPKNGPLKPRVPEPAEAQTRTSPECRWCDLLSCWHCQECGANLAFENHNRGCRHGPSGSHRGVVCAACEDSGKDSRGRLCVPCVMRERVRCQ